MNILKPAHERAWWREFMIPPSIWPAIIVVVGLGVSWAIIIAVLVTVASR